MFLYTWVTIFASQRKRNRNGNGLKCASERVAWVIRQAALDESPMCSCNTHTRKSRSCGDFRSRVIISLTSRDTKIPWSAPTSRDAYYIVTRCSALLLSRLLILYNTDWITRHNDERWTTGTNRFRSWWLCACIFFLHHIRNVSSPSCQSAMTSRLMSSVKKLCRSDSI